MLNGLEAVEYHRAVPAKTNFSLRPGRVRGRVRMRQEWAPSSERNAAEEKKRRMPAVLPVARTPQ